MSPLTTLGFGFYSRVFQAARGWIVRVARTQEASERHALEARLLPEVARHLSVAAPEPVRVLEPGVSAPFGAFAYRPLPGRLMEEADVRGPGGKAVAKDLARALAELHDFPVEEATRLGAPAFDFSTFDELRRVVTPGLKLRLSPAEWATVSAWWRQFTGDQTLREWRPVVTHGDIWWGNLTVDRGRLAGIFDWEFVGVGDPAWDLGSARQMGVAFQQDLVRDYKELVPLDATAEHRMEQWWALRVFFGVRFAVDRSDEREWTDSLRKLREGPILG